MIAFTSVQTLLLPPCASFCCDTLEQMGHVEVFRFKICHLPAACVTLGKP